MTLVLSSQRWISDRLGLQLRESAEDPKSLSVRYSRGLMLLLILGFSYIPAGHGARARLAKPQCFGRNATIVGTAGDDFLEGTPGNDVITGRGGRDSISGRGGEDWICGGRGNDLLADNRGDGHVDGGRGSDRLAGKAGTDSLYGRSGADVLKGGRQSDFFFPGRGNDIIQGGRGFDGLEYFRAPRGIKVDLENGVATGWGRDIISSVGQVEGTMFDDVIRGDDEPNALLSLGGDDVVYGRGGNDALEGFDGSDLINGGVGSDFVLFDLSKRPVTVDLSKARSRGEGKDILKAVENVFGSSQGDTLVGDARRNLFWGGPNDGGDDISGGGGNDRIFRLTGVDSLDGGRGHDSVRYFSDVVADLTTGRINGPRVTDSERRIEDLWTWHGDDVLIGNSLSNSLRSGAGSDVLVGGEGDDLLRGGAGSDALDGGGGEDRLNGGPGDDSCTNGERLSSCEESLAWPLSARTRTPLAQPDVRVPLSALVGRRWTALRLVWMTRPFCIAEK